MRGRTSEARNGLAARGLAPGVPRALAAHPVLESADVDQAHAVVSNVINPHSLRIRDDMPGLAVRQYAAEVGAVTLTYLHYGTTVEIGALEVSSCYCIQFPLAGTADIACGSQTLRSSEAVASVPSPVEPLRMIWSRDAAHLVVRVDARAVHRHLQALIGQPPDEPLRFELALRLFGSARARWFAVIEMLQAEIAWRDAARRHSGVAYASASAVEELTLNGLLLWQPNNYWERICARATPAAAPYVRRAMEYAQEHLADALPVAKLADVAGVSLRALQAGFRRELGCSPSRYVRDERLARVHDELLGCQPGATQVTTVALKWGFTHLGRFASTYQQRFGERPSVTLGRRPPAAKSAT